MHLGSCDVKSNIVPSFLVLSYDYSLYFFLGKEVCDGAEHQECAGEANHRPPAAAAHQPSGERPPEMLLLSRALPRRVEFFVHSEPEHSPGPARSQVHLLVSTVTLEQTVFSPLKKPPFTHLCKLPPKSHSFKESVLRSFSPVGWPNAS